MLGKAVKGFVSGFMGGLKNSFTGAIPQVKVDTTGVKGSDPNESHYWQFGPPRGGNGENTQKLAKIGGFGPAPRLMPNQQSSDFATSANSPVTNLNVRDTHHWTESPRSARGEVPFMSLKEYKILTNPMLNQMLNNVGSAITTVTNLENTGAAIAGAVENGAKLIKDLKNVSNGEALQKAADNFLQTADRAETQFYAHPLEPYKGLYTTTPTGFKYTLPYMTDMYRQINNQFGENTGGGMMGDAVNSLADIARNTIQDVTMQKIAQPGIYIEKPKAFTFSGRERSYTVQFPLFNTKNRAEVIKNWEFLFLLLYQNTPNRITRDLVDPPCIYEAKIPGVWYSKYACIESMQVNFVGARREYVLPIQFIESSNSNNPTLGTGSSSWKLTEKMISTVIPDAYDVTITVKELFSETQNFMYQMLNETANNTTVTVNGENRG